MGIDIKYNQLSQWYEHFLFQYKQHAPVITAEKIEIHFDLYLALSILASRNPVNSLPLLQCLFFHGFCPGI